eukprot:jgi/Mesen1/1168/ME000124S00205
MALFLRQEAQMLSKGCIRWKRQAPCIWFDVCSLGPASRAAPMIPDVCKTSLHTLSSFYTIPRQAEYSSIKNHSHPEPKPHTLGGHCKYGATSRFKHWPGDKIGKHSKDDHLILKLPPRQFLQSRDLFPIACKESGRGFRVVGVCSYSSSPGKRTGEETLYGEELSRHRLKDERRSLLEEGVATNPNPLGVSIEAAEDSPRPDLDEVPGLSEASGQFTSISTAEGKPNFGAPEGAMPSASPHGSSAEQSPEHQAEGRNSRSIDGSDGRLQLQNYTHSVESEDAGQAEGAPLEGGEGGPGASASASASASPSAGLLPTMEELSSRTRKLVEEFEEAKRALESMPALLASVPKMNPYGVYANHSLRLDRTRVYGFDYDYTIAHYTQELHSLIYNLAKDYLVNELKYPATFLHFEYDAAFPIRGLYYDKKRGYLLKLDFFHTVEPGACYFGRRQVGQEELDAVYGGTHISVEHMPNMAPILDLFALSETCLISDVIQHFVDRKLEFDASYVYADVKQCIDHVHRSQSMHRAILRNPSKYLVRNDAIVAMLRRLRASGKQLFMLTNSSFPFVDGGMRYLFQDDGRYGESWRELFDVVIANADKPSFYTSTRPFRAYNTGKDRLAFRKVEGFRQHGVYYQGNLKDFLNVYSDLRGPQRAGWRTAAIIHELEADVITSNNPEYRFQQAKFHVMQELLGKFHEIPAHECGPAEQALYAAMDASLHEARAHMRGMFNSYFGSSFLTSSGKESAFAYNVQRYADVYTSRLENFMNYSPQAWLYQPYDVKILPHHVKVGPSLLVSPRKSEPSDAHVHTDASNTLEY